ncbi:MAG: Holliday junction resolvase RuvX [Myxococcota bacterium]|nr:Holliday junction resolvase RuvX [Myxococcota bacterium]
MRILGIDLGHKRIGLALSDSEGVFAFPAGTLKSGNAKQNLKALRELIVEKEVGCAVVGLPRHMDGRKGPEAESAERFAQSLAHQAGIPVETLDERWTSVEAERALRAQGHGGRRARQHVDEVAASIILRTYLELRSNARARASAESDPAKERARHEATPMPPAMTPKLPESER